MQTISARKSAHGIEIKSRKSVESQSSADHSGLSLHELAVRICIDALAGGLHTAPSPLALPEYLAQGSTVVLTLGDTPVWTSRQDAILPHELFGSTPHDVSSGVYARHITHQQCLYHLLATRITWIGATELSLHSISSSEESHDDAAFERLVVLANELRAVAPFIADHRELLHRHMSSEQPVLLVTCDSGTVVMATPAFMRAWQPLESPVGMRFTDLMQNPALGFGSNWSTRIIQLAGNTCPVTVVTFVSQARARDEEIEPEAFLIHSLRNKLSGIVTAASFLSENACSLASDEKEMMQIIESEADELGQTLAKLDALIVQTPEKNQTTEVALALQAVADRIAGVCDNSQITISDSASGRVGYSHRDMTAIFEAVLLSHGHSESELPLTVVEGSIHDGRLNVVFRTTATPDAKNRVRLSWRAYADTISERIGATLTHESRNGGSVHLTHFESNILTQ